MPRRRAGAGATAPGRRWRAYRTAAGHIPVDEFVRRQSLDDQASIAAALKDVRDHGHAAAKLLRDEIWEVKADGERQTFRILFAFEGERSQVLLALEAFSKKSQRTPAGAIELASRRLRDWRRRGRKGS